MKLGVKSYCIFIPNILQYVYTNKCSIGGIITKANQEYIIQDEKGNYVHGGSIKKVGINFYYLSYLGLKDGCIVYTNKIRAEKALNKLKLYNQLGKLKHEFTIIQI